MNDPSSNALNEHRVTTAEQLEKLYGVPLNRALIKEIPYISAHYRAFIDASPFIIVATSGPDGLDCSPRGDPRGFVRVLDEKTVAIPDRRGNNRIDTLRNLVVDPRISLLFLIPGIGETLRINGEAQIVTEPELCRSFTMEGKAPKCVLVVTAQSVYFQCSKALVRSRLWSPDTQIERSSLPSTGEILEALSKGAFDGADYDNKHTEYIKQTMY